MLDIGWAIDSLGWAMANFDKRGGQSMPPGLASSRPRQEDTSPLMHKHSTPCHEQFAEADRQEFGASGNRFNSRCSMYMREYVDEGNCNQRCLIVECWLDLIVDAPNFNFNLGLHCVIMFKVACPNMGMHASYVCDDICTVEAG